jgi:ATPase family AAA domain-containing protein 3A/B
MEGLMSGMEKDKRETQRQNIVTTFNMLGSGLANIVSNPKFMAKTAFMSLVLFGTYHGTRVGFSLLQANILHKFNKPTLVRETSKLQSRSLLTLPCAYLRKQALMTMRRSEKDLLQGVILEKRLEDQLREISYAILNRKKHFAPCKNMMFYGPPGTGKTLFAKKLAMQSGLEYAVMVGSDIAPLGS